MHIFTMIPSQEATKYPLNTSLLDLVQENSRCNGGALKKSKSFFDARRLSLQFQNRMKS